MAHASDIAALNFQMASQKIPPSWDPADERQYCFKRWRGDLERWAAAQARQGLPGLQAAGPQIRFTRARGLRQAEVRAQALIRAQLPALAMDSKQLPRGLMQAPGPGVVAKALPQHQHVVLGGGGVRNATLVRMLQDRAGFGIVCGHEDFGMDSSAKEALAFAILAHETLGGRPGNVASATGARRGVVLGKIVTR